MPTEDQIRRERQEKLQTEAREILDDKGLIQACEPFGEVFVGGSVQSELMVWRDIDVYIGVTGEFDIDAPLAINEFLIKSLGVTSSQFADTRANVGVNPSGMVGKQPKDSRKGLRGFYVGGAAGALKMGGWKFDIWFVDQSMFETVRQDSERLATRLTEEERLAILRLKEPFRANGTFLGGYVKSVMVYESVLNGGVRSVEEFEAYAAAKQSEALDLIPDWSY